MEIGRIACSKGGHPRQAAEDSVLRLKIGDQLVASAQLTITLYVAAGY